MSEVVFTRLIGWIPKVVREDGELRFELYAGADGLHSPRTFSFPIAERHFDVIRHDLARHLLLWTAILPLCDAAGTRGPLDEDEAVALLDPILLGPVTEVDAYFRDRALDTAMLVTHGADIRLLERGQVVDSLHSATEEPDTHRFRTYVANRGHHRRGVRLGQLDQAVLTYTGQYLNSSSRPGRHPDAVDPELLSVVLQVIATAERASADLIIGDAGGEDPVERKHTVERKHAWRRMAKVVTRAVRRAHPRLVDDSIQSVALLMCSEASRRSRKPSTTDTSGQDLSDAVVLFLERYPGSNEEEFSSEVRTVAAREAVRSILDETMRIRIDWGHKSLSDIGHEVAAVMHERHPELSPAALQKLGNYFTYLVK